MKQRLLGGYAPQILEKVVIFCFDRRYPQIYIVAHLKSNILAPPNFWYVKILDWQRRWVTASPVSVKDVWGQQSHAEKGILS